MPGLLASLWFSKCVVITHSWNIQSMYTEANERHEGKT